MPGQIALAVAVDVQLAHAARARGGLLEDAGEDGLPLPRHVLRHADVDGEERARRLSAGRGCFGVLRPRAHAQPRGARIPDELDAADLIHAEVAVGAVGDHVLTGGRLELLPVDRDRNLFGMLGLAGERADRRIELTGKPDSVERRAPFRARAPTSPPRVHAPEQRTARGSTASAKSVPGPRPQVFVSRIAERGGSRGCAPRPSPGVCSAPSRLPRRPPPLPAISTARSPVTGGCADAGGPLGATTTISRGAPRTWRSSPTGGIVAVGELIDGTSNWYFGAFRYLPNGELDTSFGEGGWVDTEFRELRVPTRRRRATGWRHRGGRRGRLPVRHVLCARPLPTGRQPRPRFRRGRHRANLVRAVRTGRARSTWPSRPEAGSWPPDSCRWAATDRTARTSRSPATSPTGASTRASRATAVRRSTSATATIVAYAVASQRGGRVVVAGQGTRNRYRTEDDFAFARFRRDGRLDRSFSGDGKRTVNFGGRGFDIAYGLAVRGRSILATGSTVVGPGAGAVRCADAPRLGRRRWLAGSVAGECIPSPGGGIGRAVARRAGRPNPRGRSCLLRLLAGRFRLGAAPLPAERASSTAASERDGIVVTDFGTGEDSARAVAVHDGRILVAGSIYSSQGLARYLP